MWKNHKYILNLCWNFKNWKYFEGPSSLLLKIMFYILTGPALGLLFCKYNFHISYCKVRQWNSGLVSCVSVFYNFTLFLKYFPFNARSVIFRFRIQQQISWFVSNSYRFFNLAAEAIIKFSHHFHLKLDITLLSIVCIHYVFELYTCLTFVFKSI